MLCLGEIGVQMSPKEIEIIFRAQTENVRELEVAWKHVNRTINDALRNENNKQATFQTRMLGLIFCAYAEATFSKLIHTPHGLSGTDINQIKKKGKRDLVQGWLKCVRLSTSKIESTGSNHVPNMIQNITRLIQSYIREPSLMRNKIAHGQWKISLNSHNTAINNELTDKVKNLSVVDLYRFKAAFDKLSTILEDIIVSPNKAHWKFYWQHVTDFDNEQKAMSMWTLEKKIKELKEKSTYHKRFEKIA